MNNFQLNNNGSFSFKLGHFQFTEFRFLIHISGLSQTVEAEWQLLETNQNDNSVSQRLECPSFPGLTTILNVEQHPHGFVFQRILRNDTGSDIVVGQWRDLTGGNVGTGKKTEIYSTENSTVSFLSLAWEENPEYIPKNRPTEFCTIVNGKCYNEPILGKQLEYGRTENQPYPAQIVIDPETNDAFVLGLLSNRVADLLVAYRGVPDGDARQQVFIDTDRYFRGQSALLVKSGTTAEGEKIYCGYAKTGDLTQAVSEYNKLLENELTVRTGAERLEVFSKGRVWGSWNLGLETNISHELLLEQAERMKQNRPDLHWFQVDCGYNNITQPGIFICEPPGIDQDKFPKGMKAFTDDIKRIGLRPAIWLGLIIRPEMEIPDFARDWLLLRKNGEVMSLPRGDKFLDFSLKEVRDYFEEVIRTVTQEWGFEGIKFDFWSDHFCCTNMAYRNPEFTGNMLRDWFWKKQREYVGDDGFLLTCCCVGSGNPFIGQYADAYRCGIDVGNGDDPKRKVSSAFWYGIQAKLQTSRFLIPDIDSMGDLTRFASNELHRCWTSFAALSGAHMEWAGLARHESPDFGRQAVEAFNWIPLGRMPVPVDFPIPLQGNLAPMLWLNRSQDDETAYLAVCNWNDRVASEAFTLPLQNLDLSETESISCREFWFDKAIELNGDALPVDAIPAGDARVYIFFRNR